MLLSQKQRRYTYDINVYVNAFKAQNDSFQQLMIKRSLEFSTDKALSKRPRLEIDNKVLSGSF